MLPLIIGKIGHCSILSWAKQTIQFPMSKQRSMIKASVLSSKRLRVNNESDKQIVNNKEKKHDGNKNETIEDLERKYEQETRKGFKRHYKMKQTNNEIVDQSAPFLSRNNEIECIDVEDENCDFSISKISPKKPNNTMAIKDISIVDLESDSEMIDVEIPKSLPNIPCEKNSDDSVDKKVVQNELSNLIDEINNMLD